MSESKENLIDELRWRGMIQDVVNGTEKYVVEDGASGYIGFDPTAASLHAGSLLPIILLKHLQRHNVRPIALVGGATGRVGDPTGKSAERQLLSEEELNQNIEGIEKQLRKLLDFDHDTAPAKVVNNYDWMGRFSFLEFIRDVGKHMTVNYMAAKDSVKKRMETGISFTEFSYQLIQGYDFYHLFKNEHCALQCGGSDQWGNITTGIELIRRMTSKKAFAFTCPLLTRADGKKFGKSEGGQNIWLDPELTSPYKFYQFWINQRDEDAKKLIRMYTFLPQAEVKALEKSHEEAPHIRILQNKLAEELTVWVHGRDAFDMAVSASQILFGRSTKEDLLKLSKRDFNEIFEGVPQFEIPAKALEDGLPIIDFLTDATGILPSKGEARRALKENSISIDKEKVTSDYIVDKNAVMLNEFILAQRGKKKYFLVSLKH